MYTLYDYLPSGNGYKARLLMHQLGVPFRLVEVDLTRGESRTPEFLARNPIGKIPLLEFADGERLAESSAIIWYLADGSDLLPDDRLTRARVLQWLSFEQYVLEPSIAVVRAWLHIFGNAPSQQALEEKSRKGYESLGILEQRLAEHPFLVAGRYTIADIGLYAYTHVAGEGGFSLEPYPAVRAWIDRVAGQPGYVPITWRPAPR